jgi:hypothetical protein
LPLPVDVRSILLKMKCRRFGKTFEKTGYQLEFMREREASAQLQVNVSQIMDM